MHFNDYVVVFIRRVWFFIFKLEYGDYARLNNQVEEANRQLRHMRGDDLQGLTMEELQQLEKTLETGLRRVLHRKGEQIMEQINDLRKKVMEMTKTGKQMVAESETVVLEDGQSSDSITNISESGNSRENDDCSDTSLRLGHHMTKVHGFDDQ
ncbi:MADS-box transcription factor 55-like isoform X2 [Phalaenopsis equestris]|uniref:MADS-box transcription factor 55-like isoform X2 n=1 Tax=Phalaenopsis equestris TaxID=78828 RepID=UPI0009E528B1|nr:MADS-box transcription factor 55-like isoform X2 [Phalaenopsis equestris]